MVAFGKVGKSCWDKNSPWMCWRNWLRISGLRNWTVELKKRSTTASKNRHLTTPNNDQNNAPLAALFEGGSLLGHLSYINRVMSRRLRREFQEEKLKKHRESRFNYQVTLPSAVEALQEVICLIKVRQIEQILRFQLLSNLVLSARSHEQPRRPSVEQSNS